MSESLADFSRKHYEEGVREVAEGLRRLALRIEQEGKLSAPTLDGYVSRPTFFAQQALHELTWGVANLHAEKMFTRARDLEIALDEEAQS